MRFSHPLTNISEGRDSTSTTISQGLFGEHVEVYAQHGEYLQIRNWRDDYEGIVPLSSLMHSNDMSTHFVSVAATLLFSAPDIKTPYPLRLLYGSELVIVENIDARFAKTDTGKYVVKAHCLPMGSSAVTDIVSTAERLFLGVPYLWGGRSVNGFDCSGLVQMSAFALGMLLPRDSAMQEAFLTTDVTNQPRKRADVVFWPGHVGIMVDETNLLHATAHSMTSLIEPLQQVIQRSGEARSSKCL